MNIPGKRILLGTAVAVATLGVGGFAYAAGNDPAPDQGYVTVEEGTPTTAQQGSDGRDCPDKQGSQAQPSEQNPARDA
ncbi:hypothetical protein E1263_19845 [Kribbella antibiotica]|uniref:Uncharacterized protein n=1 Tax=Kribbella antibiotica TaxID=190195 RepID=A0A4R4ZJF6_9ACTN|nr:hypothetical protein [Kribbella antibiotica]TDD58270.1 hypothetical protein E1263_19845 [Kribbella antibiotica]